MIELMSCGTCNHSSSLHAGGTGPCLVPLCPCAAVRHRVDVDAPRQESLSVAQTRESDVAASSTPSEGDRRAEKRASTRATRERLPPERASVTKTFRLSYKHKDGQDDLMEFTFTAGLYDDGRVGEIFVRADKTGTLASGSLDGVAVMMSLLLQHGIPLREITSKLKGTRFPPASFTGDSTLPNCTSPLDLLARWLELKFLSDAGE